MNIETIILVIIFVIFLISRVKLWESFEKEEDPVKKRNKIHPNIIQLAIGIVLFILFVLFSEGIIDVKMGMNNEIILNAVGLSIIIYIIWLISKGQNSK